MTKAKDLLFFPTVLLILLYSSNDAKLNYTLTICGTKTIDKLQSKIA